MHALRNTQNEKTQTQEGNVRDDIYRENENIQDGNIQNEITQPLPESAQAVDKNAQAVDKNVQIVEENGLEVNEAAQDKDKWISNYVSKLFKANPHQPFKSEAELWRYIRKIANIEQRKKFIERRNIYEAMLKEQSSVNFLVKEIYKVGKALKKLSLYPTTRQNIDDLRLKFTKLFSRFEHLTLKFNEVTPGETKDSEGFEVVSLIRYTHVEKRDYVRFQEELNEMYEETYLLSHMNFTLANFEINIKFRARYLSDRYEVWENQFKEFVLAIFKRHAWQVFVESETRYNFIFDSIYDRVERMHSDFSSLFNNLTWRLRYLHLCPNWTSQCQCQLL